MAKDGLTHINAAGEAHMVDVGAKPATARVAVASGHLQTQADVVQAILAGTSKKGDVLATARIAGIMAAKKTADLIPLCHPLALSKVTIDIAPDVAGTGFDVRAEVATTGPTGVEMEAMTAVSVTCLTLYDMAKAMDRAMVIGAVQLEQKSGGKSGPYRRSK